MKKAGFLAMHREDIELDRHLSDSEMRLKYFLLMMTDWGISHKNYGLVKMSYEEIGGEIGWKKSKLCGVVNSLVKKGYIQKARREIKVINFEKYLWKNAKQHHKKVREIEQRVRDSEQIVQPNELNVQNNEQKDTVQTSNYLSKETINKNKENLIKKMDMSNLLK
ncbi:MAG: hypothetical protein PHU42_01265 [Patescibacteria group bacterium]|nr:hypothetical protein [Patescibacteria group bacterium]